MVGSSRAAHPRGRPRVPAPGGYTRHPPGVRPSPGGHLVNSRSVNSHLVDPGGNRPRPREDHPMTEIILMSDPKVAAVPVHDVDEPLVDVRGDSPLLVDARKTDAT